MIKPMSTHYDEKGKFFTEVVSKEQVTVYIRTRNQRIFGKLHVRYGGRVKDELNESDQFLAITDAQVLSLTGEIESRCSFMALNRHEIIWVIPEEDLVDLTGAIGEAE
jgi:hypothetical protein